MSKTRRTASLLHLQKKVKNNKWLDGDCIKLKIFPVLWPLENCEDYNGCPEFVDVAHSQPLLIASWSTRSPERRRYFYKQLPSHLDWLQSLWDCRRFANTGCLNYQCSQITNIFMLKCAFSCGKVPALTHCVHSEAEKLCFFSKNEQTKDMFTFRAPPPTHCLIKHIECVSLLMVY